MGRMAAGEPYEDILTKALEEELALSPDAREAQSSSVEQEQIAAALDRQGD
jgi:hypothetical protein